MRRLVELYGELSGGTHGFIDFPLPWRSVQLASVAVRMLDTLVQLAFAADPSLGVSVPLATSPLGVLVPLAPPAGIAAPAHPTVPSPSFSSSASAAFSPPSEGNRGAPPPHRFHIGPASALRKGGWKKKGRGLFPFDRLHVDVGGPALGEAELVALRGAASRAPGRVRRRIPAAVVHASVHACDAAPPERVILHARSAVR